MRSGQLQQNNIILKCEFLYSAFDAIPQGHLTLAIAGECRSDIDLRIQSVTYKYLESIEKLRFAIFRGCQ